MLSSLILAAILHLMPAPSPAWDETPSQYQARAQLIAEAIASASDGKRQRAMAIVVVFWGESRFSPLIHAGVRRGDHGKSLCLGQHKQLTRTEEQWEALAGVTLEATTRCARATGDALVKAWHYCKSLDGRSGYAEAMTLYGSGRTCRPEETPWASIFRDRGDKWTRLMARALL